MPSKNKTLFTDKLDPTLPASKIVQAASASTKKNASRIKQNMQAVNNGKLTTRIKAQTLTKTATDLLREKRTTATKLDAFTAAINDDPLFFHENVLGTKPWKIQRQIIRYVMHDFSKSQYIHTRSGERRVYNRTTVKSCHGVGKTYVCGSIALQFLMCNAPSIVITTAPTFRQVEKAIWKEIRTCYENAKIPLGGSLYSGQPMLSIKKDQWYAMGLSTQDGDRLQGIHEKNILVLVDEAAGIPETIYNSIDGLLTTQNAKLLLIGNPTSAAGTFRKSFDLSGWNKVSISAYDTPNFKFYGITEQEIQSGSWYETMQRKKFYLPYPKLVTPQWVAERYSQWGPDSALYQSRVLGEFSDEGDDTLIPLSWVEAAFERGQEFLENEAKNDYSHSVGLTQLGVDVAEYGRDSSVVYCLKGRKVLPPWVYTKQKVMQLVGRISNIYSQVQADVVKVDTIGVGTGVEGRLDELGFNTLRVNVGEGPGGLLEEPKLYAKSIKTTDALFVETEKEKFANKRAQLYWNLRMLLDPSNPEAIGIVAKSNSQQADLLAEELTATKYEVDSKGRIKIIPKSGNNSIKEAIGRSPDFADALMIACAPSEMVAQSKRKRKARAW